MDPDPFESITNQDESPLAIEGELLVERVGDELWQWDMSTMRRVDVFALPTRSFTVLADGSIVTWGQEAPDAAECVLHRLRNGTLTKYTTLACTASGELVRRAATSDGVYIVQVDRVVQYRFAGSKLVEVTTFALPSMSPSAFAQVTSLEDGRLVVARGDGVAIVGPERSVELRETRGQPRHLARAARGFWYSFATRRPREVDAVVLAGEREVVTNLAPARVVHMAAHGDALAVLLATGPTTWHVALVDGGRERWRVRVDARGTKEMARAAVAMSATHLVMHSESGLRAWTVADGKLVETQVTVPKLP